MSCCWSPKADSYLVAPQSIRSERGCQQHCLRCHDVRVENRARALRIDGVSKVLLRSNGFCQKTCRALWSLVFVAFTVVCLLLVLNTVHIYLEYRVTTNYRTSVQSVLVAFPMVVVCNRNPWNSAYAVSMFALANIGNTSLAVAPIYHNYDVLTQLEDFQKQTTGAYLTYEQRKQLSDLDGLIISCTFQASSTVSSILTFIICFFFNNQKERH